MSTPIPVKIILALSVPVVLWGAMKVAGREQKKA
jgi:hypothetical protein